MNMARVISISELKKDFYRLTEEVAGGTTIIVTKRGKMKARFEPLSDVQQMLSAPDLIEKNRPSRSRKGLKRKGS